MKVATQHRDIQSGGLVARQDFTIKPGAHIMAVLSGLYKDPIDAMIREYLTNMYDAIAALRRTNPTAEILPATLSLPTSLNPELVFKDMGIGMSCETVMSVYSQYGNSTKNDSNLEVGGFGLGSKTAFCYNNGSTWTIESRYEGQKHVFMASIGESGIPFLAHVSSAPSSDHSGVTIRIPILREDISSCVESAQRYVPYFTLPLTVEGADKYSSEKINKKVEYTVKGDGWGIRKGADSYSRGRDWRIVMGNVPYDVAWHDLRLPNGSGSGGFYTNDFDLYVPIGSVDIVPSRDALKMTDRTRVAITTAMSGVVKELEQMLTTEIQSAPTYWDALLAFSNLNTVKGAREVVKSVKWKGRDIDGVLGVTTTMAQLWAVDPHATVAQYGIVDTDKSTIDVKMHMVAGDTIRLRTEHTWLVIENMPKGIQKVKSHLYENLVNHTSYNGKSRTQRYGHKIGHALMVKTTATPQQLSALFDGYPVDRMMKVSDLRMGKLPASAKSSVDTIYRWNGSQWDARVNIPTEEKYFLTLSKGQNGRYVWTDEKDNYRHNFVTTSLIDYAAQFGIDAAVGNLYGVKTDEVDKLDSSLFTNLYDAVQKKVLAEVKKHRRAIAVIPTLEVSPEKETTWLSLFKKIGIPKQDSAEFQKLSDALTERAAVRAGTTYTKMYNESFLSVNTLAEIKSIASAEAVEDVVKLVDKISKKYPMIAMIVDLISGDYYYQSSSTDRFVKYKKVLLDFWCNIR